MKIKSPRITKLSKWLIILMIITATAIGTLVAAAYLKKTDEVKNSFDPASSINPTISETFENKTEKKDVVVEVGDTGYPVYVRAKIVFTWKKSDDTVYFSKPDADEGDYQLRLNTTDWEKGSDGYYYYKTPVQSGGTTPVLIESCTQIGDPPAEDYTLSVEILAQTVQAVGHTDGENSTPEKEAWKDAWNLS